MHSELLDTLEMPNVERHDRIAATRHRQFQEEVVTGIRQKVATAEVWAFLAVARECVQGRCDTFLNESLPSGDDAGSAAPMVRLPRPIASNTVRGPALPYRLKSVPRAEA